MLLLLLLLLPCTQALPSCSSLTSCSSCMSLPACVWCTATPHNSTRCSIRGSSDCPEADIVDNDNRVTIRDSQPLSSRAPYVQISPQAVSLELRPGKTGKVTFQVSQAVDYPVDLYFLMDLSWSMRDTKDTLARVGGSIIQNIRNRTKALATGFGSFVEKNLPPFSSAVPEFNCSPDNPNCAPPYSFHHKAPLADISDSAFSAAVLSSPLAGNVDDPEGSLDALMQVMVCQERIGWREKSRRIILLATDRDFHWALDGRLAGILTPNDGQCHLNSTKEGAGYYTEGESQDYPSLSHISSVAQEGNFNIVFAVTKKYQAVYEELARQLLGRAHVAVLDQDGSNIMDVVLAGFTDITTSIKVASRGSGQEVGVSFFTDCGSLSQPRRGSECQDIPLGTPVTFTAEVNVSTCLDSPQTLYISPVGITETLKVDVSSSCSCSCSPPEPSSSYCSGLGTLECGLCQCDSSHYGERCQCSLLGGREGGETCLQPGVEGPPCSGRGECSCGVCQCRPTDRGRIYGSYCECDDFSCPVNSLAEVCSGQGSCSCGSCNCSPGWGGADCGCKEGGETCLSPYDGQVCSGNGDCRCGKCVCGAVGSSSNLYVGDFCQTDPTSQSPCEELRLCVECQAFQSGALAEDCSAACPTFSLDYRETGLGRTIFQDGSPCTATNTGGCSYSYSYRLNATAAGSPPVLWVVLHTTGGQTQKCQDIVMPLSIGAGALVLLLGLLSILFYKCYIVIDDRRQYARFQSEAEQANFPINQSGIYKSPITRTLNPMYGQ